MSMFLGGPPRISIEPKVINLKEGQRMIVQYSVSVSWLKIKCFCLLCDDLFSHMIQLKFFGINGLIKVINQFHHYLQLNPIDLYLIVLHQRQLVLIKLLYVIHMVKIDKNYVLMLNHDVVVDVVNNNHSKLVHHKFVFNKNDIKLVKVTLSTLSQIFL
jgi:hypothetical protein